MTSLTGNCCLSCKESYKSNSLVLEITAIHLGYSKQQLEPLDVKSNCIITAIGNVVGLSLFLLTISEIVPIDPLHKPFLPKSFLVSITVALTARNSLGYSPAMSSEANFMLFN